MITNGLFDTEVALKLAESRIDTVSVMLASDNPVQYEELMQPQEGRNFGDVCNFVVTLAELGVNVECTAVNAPGVKIDAVNKLATSLGAIMFRTREYVPL